jgi:hypothetical protein
MKQGEWRQLPPKPTASSGALASLLEGVLSIVGLIVQACIKVLATLWSMLMLWCSLLLTGILMFATSFFVPLEETSTLWGRLTGGTDTAFYLAFAGVMLVYLCTLFLPVAEVLLKPVSWLFTKDENWLTSRGRQLAAFALLPGILTCYLIFLGVPAFERLVAFSVLLMPVGAGLVMVEAKEPRIAKLYAMRGARWSLTLSMGLFVIVLLKGLWAGHQDVVSSVRSTLDETMSSVSSLFEQEQSVTERATPIPAPPVAPIRVSVPEPVVLQPSSKPILTRAQLCASAYSYTQRRDYGCD